MTRVLFILSFVAALSALIHGVPTLEARAAGSLDAEKQARVDAWKTEAAAWAADSVIITAVTEQNAKGPLAGMTEEKWKSLKPRSAEVKAFEDSTAGKWLKGKLEASKGAISELFLNGAKGEKVAFTDKTSSYCHKGKAKFDKPFESKAAWQGEPEFDESTQTESLQISVPVLERRGEGEQVEVTVIGVLVIGIDLSKL